MGPGGLASSLCPAWLGFVRWDIYPCLLYWSTDLSFHCRQHVLFFFFLQSACRQSRRFP